jgi:hypothetical protein
METAHKFLAFKGAFTSNYKAQNFITAAHFARLVTDLENSGIIKKDIVDKYKKNY